MPSPDTMDRIVGCACAASAIAAVALLAAEAAGWVA